MALHSTKIDVVEEKLQQLSPSLLRALLKDKTTRGNITWATNDYSKEFGDAFACDREITERLVTGKHWNIIQPRTAKLKQTQDDRTKARAEVFTPSWVCNRQNNMVDERWFGRKNVFNEEVGKEWITFHDKISFPEEHTWQEYVDNRRLEMTCGEAPYLVSRYDATTGEFIKPERRIGILDRKFRILHENATNNEEWLKWALRALQATYGFEFQGDSLLIARENILYTFIDNYKYHFKVEPDVSILKKVINIIVWNFWQMDGRTYTVPYIVNRTKVKTKLPLLEAINTKTSDNSAKITPPKSRDYCLIMNWRKRKKVIFKTLLEGETK